MMPESYGRNGRRWLADHPGWRVEPGLGGDGYYAWRPDGGAAPVAASSLDDLAAYAHEAEAAKGYRDRMNYVDEARRKWPEAVWIIGNGRYASVAHCGSTSVMLFPTQAEATQAQAFINRHGCGADCQADHRPVDPSSDHQIIDLA